MKNKLPLFLAGAALLSAAPSVWAASDRVCFEAEKFSSIESPLKKVNLSGVSGGGAIEIPWDKNATKGIGSATYKFNAPAAGVYYVWARTFWANGCGNTIKVNVNGSGDNLVGEDGNYDNWHWVGGKARVRLKAGVNTLVLKNSETGVKVDQFFFCKDSYVPVGMRKATS